MSPSPNDLIDRLRLIRAEGVGTHTFYKLLRRYGSAARAIAALPGLGRQGGRVAPPRVPARGEIERELKAAARIGARALAWDQQDYPPLLAQLDDPPPVVFLRGDPARAGRQAVGVVGARNASAGGMRFAATIAAELAAAGFAVVSGLARGIDGAAHQGALDAGPGTDNRGGGTVAVLAGGIDQPYPPEHQKLYERIAAEGAVIAEQPVGWVAQARDFPRRNRLIAGLSLGVVVVEAAIRSGSLITARLAGEQGREVFAVPGSPLDPRCRGSNDLIRQGATLTESAADVLAALSGPLAARPVPRAPADVTQAIENTNGSASEPDEAEVAAGRRRVLEALSPTPVEVDEIIRRCQLSAPVVQAVLLELELAGRLSRYPGSRVALEPS
ncbi:MAG: DNA-processing protein DprA [Alphaproteobacteria bacterium]|nr:DNA-processing protein DprA [Alphaproteobacteria bacterium]